MDYSNREGADANDRGDRSKSRGIALAIILVILAVFFGATQLVNGYRDSIAKKEASEYSAFMTEVSKADAITDPQLRCLNYPDPPGSHWDEETTQAYCQLRNHQTLLLSQIEALLKQGKADEVDRTFQSYLDAQLHDPKQPGLLDTAFYRARFHEATDSTRRIIDMWKQQSPNSPFALAASGEQYVEAAHKARGSDWARNLSDQQTQRMNEQLALARQDLERAATLLSTVTPVYSSMIHTAGLQGDEGYMDQAAALGLKADPANFNIRSQMMMMSQPKWGSAFGGEDEQKSQTEAMISRNPLLRLVAQEPAVYRATCDCGDTPSEVHRLLLEAADKNLSYGDLEYLANEAYDSDPRMAIELYSEELRFNPSEVDALQWRSQLMLRLGDKKGAIETIAEAAHRFPEDNAIATQLANIYSQAGDVKDAEDTYLAILNRDPDEQLAMAQLGDLYNHAGHQPDKAEVLADTLISRHPENPDGYIVRSCNQMDHNLPGVYETIHYFIDHFGDDPQFKTQTAEMRGYLARHPEKTSS
jgi:tetratricopeptide (TPR) repeat protein